MLRRSKHLHFLTAAVVCLLLSLPSLAKDSFSLDFLLRYSRRRYTLERADAKFALDLYQRQTAATTGNIVMSPLSISVALAMTYVGARGNTKEQMRHAMRFGLGIVHRLYIDHMFNVIRLTLNKPYRSYTWYMANRLFGQKSYRIRRKFVSSCRRYYGRKLAQVDFAGNKEGAIDSINNWVAENTDRKITEILSGDSVDDMTRLVLISASYFKGNWAMKFNKSLTTRDNFHTRPNETVNVEMLRMNAVGIKYGFNKYLRSQAIELPCDGINVSMYIILPNNTVIGMSRLEKNIKLRHLMKVEEKFNMKPEAVEIALPKFKIDEKLQLRDMLSRKGMADLFTPSTANLSGISRSHRLHLANVFHHAILDVTEDGRPTAAAGSTAGLATARNDSIPISKFRADHPFMFFIKHKLTESILFIGRVTCFDAGCKHSDGF